MKIGTKVKNEQVQTRLKINVINLMKRIKEKNTQYEEKVFDKIKHLYMSFKFKKKLSKLEIEGNFLNLIKKIYKTKQNRLQHLEKIVHNQACQ